MQEVFGVFDAIANVNSVWEEGGCLSLGTIPRVELRERQWVNLNPPRTKVDRVNTDSTVMLHPVSSEPENLPFTVKIMRDWTLQVTIRKMSETSIPFSWIDPALRGARWDITALITHTMSLYVWVRVCMCAACVCARKYVRDCMCICPRLYECGWVYLHQITRKAY